MAGRRGGAMRPRARRGRGTAEEGGGDEAKGSGRRVLGTGRSLRERREIGGEKWSSGASGKEAMVREELVRGEEEERKR